MENNFVPMSTSLESTRSIGANFTLSVPQGQRYFYFSTDAANRLSLIAGDRVGFLLDKSNDMNNYIYITSNTVGTAPIKKYKAYPYRVDNAKFAATLQSIYMITHPGVNVKLHINFDISIKVKINGKDETAYLITTSVAERADLDDFIKEAIKEKYNEIFKSAKNAKHE